MTAPRRDRASGSSLLELLVVITMIAILTAVGVSTFRSSLYAFDGAVTELVSDLRMTRTLAQSRGAHYRLVVLSDASYAIERLQPNADGVWESARTDRRQKTLDFAVRFDSPPGTAVEFDTRGTRVGLERIPLDLEERRTGAVGGANVWPSGQVIKK